MKMSSWLIANSELMNALWPPTRASPDETEA